MKDRKQFIKSWGVKRQKGKLKYVLINAGAVGSYGLVGIILGSLFLYNSPSAYSFSNYLPIYIGMFLGLSLIAAPVFTYKWNKNEGKFGEL